ILSALGRLPESESEPDWEAEFNRHIPMDIKSSNPLMFNSVAEGEIQTLTSITLFAFDWNFDTFADADIVTSWQTSKDRLWDKVVLRDDLTWSDGKPFTAHDIVFSYRAIMDERVPVLAFRPATSKLRWVEAYDDRTLVYFHKESLATNVHNMLFPVIPKHGYEESIKDDYTLQNSKRHVEFEDKPVTSGAYQVVSRRRSQEIVLERRESWYMHDGKQVRDKPFIKTMRFRVIEDPNTALLALKTGKLDAMILQPEQWTTQTTSDEYYEVNTKARGVEWTYFYFGWCVKDEDGRPSPFFADPRVRKAMAYAFDYDELLNKLCYGLYSRSYGIFAPGAWMAPKKMAPLYQQDLHKAEQLLDEAGWIDHNGDGVRDKEIDGRLVPFKFNVICSNAPERIAMCNLLKENLDQIGVICNVRPMEFTVLTDKELKHNFQAALGGWGTGTDPYTLENLWKTDEKRNFINYSNPEVDRLFKEGLYEFDREKRAAIYARIHEIIYDDQAVT